MSRYCQLESSPAEPKNANGSFSGLTPAGDGIAVRRGGGGGGRTPLPLPLANSSTAERLKNLKSLAFLSRPKEPKPSDLKDLSTLKDPSGLPTSAFLQKSAKWLEKGGLAQSHSPRGAESMVRFLRSAPPPLFPPPNPLSPPIFSQPSWQATREYAFWVSDEGKLNVEAFHQLECFPLENLIVAYPTEAREVWRTGLEAIQTGLFRWAFLKTSEGCEPSFLRKLQLASEKVNCRTFILCTRPLPHWLFRFSFGEITQE